MQILINNKPTATEATNLSLLADELALPAQGVAIAVSNQMVPRTAWDATPLHEGDNVIIIKAACGGGYSSFHTTPPNTPTWTAYAWHWRVGADGYNSA